MNVNIAGQAPIFTSNFENQAEFGTLVSQIIDGEVVDVAIPTPTPTPTP